MINSLIQDSHITQTLCHSQKNHDTHKNAIRCAQVERSKAANERRDYFCATVNNQGITATKPAKISFSGRLNPEAARLNLEDQTVELSNPNKLLIEKDSNFLDVIEKTKKFLPPNSHKDSKAVYNDISKIIIESVDSLNVSSTNISKESKKFLEIEENKNSINKLVEYIKNLLKPKDAKDPKKVLSGNVLHKSIKSVIKEGTKILAIAENPSKIYKNEQVKKLLEKAADSPVVFSALFALALTSTLRPAAIMALPGQKKNKDDKKYASAHSIASGVIGYIVSLAVFAPIASALKVIGKNPEKYLLKNDKKNIEKVNYLGDPLSPKFRAAKEFNRVKKVVGMFPEVILAAPKAILTIALVPPILKYVFRMEKKKSEGKDDFNPILQNYALLNFKSQNTPEKKVFQSFSGGAN